MKPSERIEEIKNQKLKEGKITISGDLVELDILAVIKYLDEQHDKERDVNP